jgi:hypothetical protein
MRFFWLLTLAASAAFAQRDQQPSGPPPLDEAAQKKVIEDTMAHARAYVKELPDFVCTQVTRRNEDQKGTNQWKTLETINEQLTFIGGKQQYQTVAVNGKKASGDRPGWVMPASDFAKFLDWTFDPKSQAEISWSNWDALRGHRVHLLGLTVKKDNSPWMVQKGKAEPIRTGYFGVLDVDAETGAILKLGVVATDLPKTYPISTISVEMHWEFAKIGDHWYLVPFRAESHTKEGKVTSWYEVEFRDYRKPGATATAQAK